MAPKLQQPADCKTYQVPSLGEFVRTYRYVLLIAVMAWIAVVACIDPSGNYPSLPEGPGLTVDEIFNAEQGYYLVSHARALGWLNLVPGTSAEAYKVANGYNPDHPPLGRWWLGVHHEVVRWIFPAEHPSGVVIITACARTGSATAFALTVFLIGWYATRTSGALSGVFASLSLVLMPRVFGHAHLASLETITNLTCTLGVITACCVTAKTNAPCWRAGIFLGVILSLAFLTKIQAILIPVPMIVWMIGRWKMRAIVPIAACFATTSILFFLLWPYLWSDPVNHLLEYLGRTTNRATIYAWYLGQKYPDKLLPWHYPFVIFGLTVPVGLHCLGVWGAVRSWFQQQKNIGLIQLDLTKASGNSAGKTGQKSSTEVLATDRAIDRLLLMEALFPLVLFAIPGIAVYDCERLFLTSFPLWAIFAGRGWALLWQQLQIWFHSTLLASVGCAGLLAQMAIPLVTMAPCHLAYYNEIVMYAMGGVDQAGLESDYWGVGMTRTLLQDLVKSIPEGSTVTLSPTLHQFQADDLMRQSPILNRARIQIRAAVPDQSSVAAELVYLRKADLAQERLDVQSSEIMIQTVRQKHRLAYVVDHPR